MEKKNEIKDPNQGWCEPIKTEKTGKEPSFGEHTKKMMPAFGFAIHWNDAEEKRPAHADKIIFENPVGLYWGVFYNTEKKVVLVENRQSDCIDWDNIERWILYPSN